MTTSPVATRAVSDRSTAPAPAPVLVVGARLPRRRRWGLTAAGLALVVVCAVAAYLLVVTAGVTRPYLVLRRDVPYGTPITAADLSIADVNPAAGLRAVAAVDRGQVIGKRATTDLFAGGLLAPAQLAATVIPAPGQQLVGIEVKPGQVPARALHPGDTVTLIVVAAAALSGVPDAKDDTARPQSIPATVAAQSPPQSTGTVRVDVGVSPADGPTVAAMAAAGRIVIVVTGRS